MAKIFVTRSILDNGAGHEVVISKKTEILQKKLIIMMLL